MLAAATLAVRALPAYAQTRSTPRIDARQERQQRRIGQGVQSDAPTGKEAAWLEKGRARVQKLEAKAVADAKVTRKERRGIEHPQDQQSRKIRRQKHERKSPIRSQGLRIPAAPFLLREPEPHGRRS